MVAWSAADEQRLFSRVAEVGTKWSVLCKELGVTDNDVKNRWYSARRRLVRKLSVSEERATDYLCQHAFDVFSQLFSQVDFTVIDGFSYISGGNATFTSLNLLAMVASTAAAAAEMRAASSLCLHA